MPASQHLLTANPPHSSVSVTNDNLTVHGSTLLIIVVLQKGIQEMVFLCLEISRPNTEENEAFTACFTPILDQMDALHIPAHHRPAIIFILLVGKARRATSRLPLSSTIIDDMLQDIKKLFHTIEKLKIVVSYNGNM